jgi:hypothetical protein
MRRVAFLPILALLACSSSTSNPSQPDTGTTADAATDAPTMSGGYVDPNAGGDPVPADLPEPKAYDGSADVAPDLSCAGMKMPLGTTAADREIHTIQTGGTDTDRVPNVDVEVFTSNTNEGAPTATGKSAMDGMLTMKLPTGYMTFRTKGGMGYVETLGYDYFVVDGKPLTVQASPADKVQALESLSTEDGSYMHTAGTGRYVAQVTDCKNRPLSNTFVVLESDTKLVVPGTASPAMRRNYFGDNALPSSAKFTSRSGVVAMLDVPLAGKLRAVAWAKTGGALKPIAVRALVVPADVVTTSLITPFVQ